MSVIIFFEDYNDNIARIKDCDISSDFISANMVVLLKELKYVESIMTRIYTKRQLDEEWYHDQREYSKGYKRDITSQWLFSFTSSSFSDYEIANRPRLFSYKKYVQFYLDLINF